jgi:predicted ester cyclase
MAAEYTPAEENKNVVRRFWEEVLGKRELNVADEILASNCKLNSDDDPAIKVGDRDGIKDFIELLHVACPDMQVTIQDQIAEADKVVTRWAMTGLNQGEILGMAPTGKQMVAQGISVSKISDGKIEEISESSRRSFEEPVRSPAASFAFHWFRWF